MKKLISIVLTLACILPFGAIAHAEPVINEVYWTSERPDGLYDALGASAIYFTPVQETDAYCLNIYKDNNLIAQQNDYYSPYDELSVHDVTSVIRENGSGSYTCSVTLYDKNSSIDNPVILSTGAMSSPFVYTEPTKQLLPVTNVVLGDDLTFEHNNEGTMCTYQISCYAEYSDGTRKRIAGHLSMSAKLKASNLDFLKKTFADKAENGTEMVLGITANAFNINDGLTSPETFFYPASNKTVTDAPIAPAPVAPTQIFTVAKNADIIFAGAASHLEAYNIFDNNYFKLRDIAASLTNAGFNLEVTWDAEKQAINLVTGTPYTYVGGENKAADGETREALESTAQVYLNSAPVDLKAYNINGNNFFKLRDLCTALDIFVDWDAQLQTIIVDPTQAYKH